MTQPPDSALDIRARELLVAELVREDFPDEAARVLNNNGGLDDLDVDWQCSLRAIKAALLDPPIIDREAIRREAFEEAASVADKRAAGFVAASRRSDQSYGRMLEAEHLADTLRALSPTTAPIDQAQGVGDG